MIFWGVFPTDPGIKLRSSALHIPILLTVMTGTALKYKRGGFILALFLLDAN